jgi:hypothetical protein
MLALSPHKLLLREQGAELTTSLVRQKMEWTILVGQKAEFLSDRKQQKSTRR